MTDERRKTLWRAAKQFGTPLYVYFGNDVSDRIDLLDRLFGGRFGISFAVKANPNVALLRHMLQHVTTYDVSSFAEVQRVLAAGGSLEKITFSGPGKRDEEIRRAVELGVGELVCESIDEAQTIARYASQYGRIVDILIRLNPLRIPRDFGVNMAGKPSQFGIDEELMDDAIGIIAQQKNTRLTGFHIYSGTNCLNPKAIVENFAIFVDLFDRACRLADLEPQKLIFGSGFGIPYLPDEKELDVANIAVAINPMTDQLKATARYRSTQSVLEMGRWLIGQAGYLLTSVIGQKLSRGTQFRICDAGFNNHLSACGMMGTVIRRNWRIHKISPGAEGDGALETCNLVGPLCTTIDLIAGDIKLPPLRRGDVLAIEGSGAYAHTASPSRFISHPEPREVLATRAGEFVDVSESLLNHWDRPPARL